MRLTLVFFLFLSGASSMILAQKKTDLIEDLKALNELVGRKDDEISRLKKITCRRRNLKSNLPLRD